MPILALQWSAVHVPTVKRAMRGCSTILHMQAPEWRIVREELSLGFCTLVDTNTNYTNNVAHRVGGLGSIVKAHEKVGKELAESAELLAAAQTKCELAFNKLVHAGSVRAGSSALELINSRTESGVTLDLRNAGRLFSVHKCL